MSAWTQVTAHLSAPPEDWSPWHEIFESHGVPGTVQTDHPPTLSGYIAPGDEPRIPELTAALTAHGAIEVTTGLVPEVNWAEAWKQFFVPRRIEPRILIRPTWEEAPLQPGEIEIVLDPGEAFGTGDHPTTRMCLSLIQTLPLEGKSVADIGCGSGILAIAARKLGAATCDCVDVESPSVASTRENAARNHVTLNVAQGLGFQPLDPTAVYDVVLSNIISAALIELSPVAAQRVKPGGYWMVSGINHGNWPDVRAAAERQGFTLHDHRTEGEWNAALFLH